MLILISNWAAGLLDLSQYYRIYIHTRHPSIHCFLFIPWVARYNAKCPYHVCISGWLQPILALLYRLKFVTGTACFSSAPTEILLTLKRMLSSLCWLLSDWEGRLRKNSCNHTPCWSLPPGFSLSTSILTQVEHSICRYYVLPQVVTRIEPLNSMLLPGRWSASPLFLLRQGYTVA